MVIPFSIFLTYNHKYVKNPYAKSKLVEVISRLTMELDSPSYPGNEFALRGILESSPFVIRYLTPMLMTFYSGMLSCHLKFVIECG